MTDTLLNEAFGRLTQVPGSYPIIMQHTANYWQHETVVDDAVTQALWSGEYTFMTYTTVNSEPETPHTLVTITNALPHCELIRGVQTLENQTAYIFRGGDWMAGVSISEGHVYIHCVTHTQERGMEIVKPFSEKLKCERVTEDLVAFQVWAGGEYPSYEKFDANAMKWSNVKNNYPTKTREPLDQLMKMVRTPQSTDGKLILLHGEPGTGKTTAIKSLLESWRTWRARACLVIDPDRMLASPKYLLQVLDSIPEGAVRVIIIEDADEICSKNGPRNSSMSRLLQLLDGLMGSTKPIMVLMTTNASPNDLDTALTRKGRCCATIEFVPFSPEEATQRLGGDIVVDTPLTLAEIYNHLGENTMITNQTSTSFGQYL
jgi:ATPase family associated with various cellular activities (AAA)